MNEKTKNTINDFQGISLNEMNEVSLMKRTDTKFVIPENKLDTLLKSVRKDYRILEINENRVMTYKSLYFDTEDNQFYLDHHNKRNNRTKIRIRNYVESNLFFLEIKQKDSKGVTHKSRTCIDDFELELSLESNQFISNSTSKDYQLIPAIWNGFNRITLVNVLNKERITVDFNLRYNAHEQQEAFNNLAIVEVKQERYDRNTPLVRKLKLLNYHPYSFSKYCVGMMCLNTDLKNNQFKKKLIQIKKITRA